MGIDKLEEEAGLTFDHMFDIARRAEFTWRAFKHCTQVFEFIVNSKQEISQLGIDKDKLQLDCDDLKRQKEGLKEENASLEQSNEAGQARQLELIEEISRLTTIANSKREAILALG